VSAGNENEGEGNRTAAKDYNERTRRFVDSGQVQGKAREAAKALDGAEKAELQRAEKEGLAHSHGEDPALKRK